MFKPDKHKPPYNEGCLFEKCVKKQKNGEIIKLHSHDYLFHCLFTTLYITSSDLSFLYSASKR